MPVELFEDKKQRFFVIKDGDSTLKLSDEEFQKMTKDGRSPLLKKLWDEAKKEREIRGKSQK